MGSLPASEEVDLEECIAFGRLVGERTELTSVPQLTSFFCDGGRYLEKTLCAEQFQAEQSCGRTSHH